jgi:hypothetical protein
MRTYCASVCRGGDVSQVRRHELRTRRCALVCSDVEDAKEEYADTVVRGERKKERCGTLKRRGGRDTHSGRVGDWNGEKYTKSAQVDYTR